MGQKMKRVTLIASAPLRRPQILPLRVRHVHHVFHHAQSPRVSSRIDRRQFTQTTQTARRPSDSRSSAFKKYTLPQNYTPDAAIDLPAKMSAVQEPPRKRMAYVALGSNMGDRIGWIEKACNEMDARGIRVTRTSSLWETEPMYVLDQDRFVNGACEVCLCPLRLMCTCD
jgi:2-amino-4-hydroxy-6-hydroxymethyldihydropteridine diphosphokinase/dihydropteroate synthase